MAEPKIWDSRPARRRLAGGRRAHEQLASLLESSLRRVAASPLVVKHWNAACRTENRWQMSLSLPLSPKDHAPARRSLAQGTDPLLELHLDGPVSTLKVHHSTYRLQCLCMKGQCCAHAPTETTNSEPVKRRKEGEERSPPILLWVESGCCFLHLRGYNMHLLAAKGGAAALAPLQHGFSPLAILLIHFLRIRMSDELDIIGVRN